MAQRFRGFSDWIILIALLSASLVLMLNQNQTMVRNIRILSLDYISRIESQITWAQQLRHVMNDNERLRQENLQLISQLSRLNAALLEEPEHSDALQFHRNSGYEMVGGRVISRDIFGIDNFLTLNIGSAHGVEENMPVVSPEGILGRVWLVSTDYCRVLSYLNPAFRVPVEIRPSMTVGIASWAGQRADRLHVEHVAKTSAIDIGDQVVTSSTSHIFPPGHTVGVIAEVDTLRGMNYLDVTLRPTADVEKTQFAFVLLHEPDDERATLEQETLN